jgi:hypothetical protein
VSRCNKHLFLLEELRLERRVQDALDVLRTEDPDLQAFFGGAWQRLHAKELEQLVPSIDVPDPALGPAVDDVGQVGQRRRAEIEQLLALAIALAALTGKVLPAPPTPSEGARIFGRIWRQSFCDPQP